jgi:hypothetical protein
MKFSFMTGILAGGALALLGGGCAPAPVPSPSPSEPATPAAEEPVLPQGTYKTKQGHLDRVRDIAFVNMVDGRVQSPLLIVGEARLWYFEASFPVKLLNESGREIATGYASADGDWMTEDWVPFTAELTFAPQPSGSRGMLVFEKDNPSGLPENDDRIEIPVIF